MLGHTHIQFRSRALLSYSCGHVSVVSWIESKFHRRTVAAFGPFPAGFHETVNCKTGEFRNLHKMRIRAQIFLKRVAACDNKSEFTSDKKFIELPKQRVLNLDVKQ